MAVPLQRHCGLLVGIDLVFAGVALIMVALAARLIDDPGSGRLTPYFAAMVARLIRAL